MDTDPTAMEYYFLDFVNGTRANVGASPLTFDPELMAAADSHHAWMDANDTLSHTGANGSSPYQRIADAGYDGEDGGFPENLWFQYGNDPTGATAAATPHFVEASHDWFVNSPLHYAVMTDPDFENFGISFQKGDYDGYPAVWATLTFGTPTDAEAAENAAADAAKPPPGPPTEDYGRSVNDPPSNSDDTVKLIDVARMPAGDVRYYPDPPGDTLRAESNLGDYFLIE